MVDVTKGAEYEELGKLFNEIEDKEVGFEHDALISSLSQELSTRDILITELLTDYVKQRPERINSNGCKKNLMFWVFLGTFIAMTVGVFLLSWKALKNPMSMAVTLTITSLFLTYIGSIMIILRSITQYLFPIDEEKNFSEMIKTIIQKDIEQQKSLVNKDSTTTKE